MNGTFHRRYLLVAAALAAALWLTGLSGPRPVTADTLPARISDGAFRQLIAELSEPAGNFRSDNLVSNEINFQHILPALAKAARPGGAYLGVGPEQNFTYAVALRPAIVFIVDIRRGNMDLHLLYKALFEISADRAEFVSRLFSRPRPSGLGAGSSIAEIFEAVSGVRQAESVFTQNLSDVRNHLLNRRGLVLSEADLDGIQYIYRAFFMLGPSIRYSPIGLANGTTQPTYAELMAAADQMGTQRGFLATEAAFAYVKDLEARNLIVPVVGNFAGPKTIRAIGQYLRQREAVVSAFYVSNVEEYLVQDGIWRDFCANVAALPLTPASTFIRSLRIDGPRDPTAGFSSELVGMAAAVRNCNRNAP
jgi:hypothetical protein